MLDDLKHTCTMKFILLVIVSGASFCFIIQQCSKSDIRTSNSQESTLKRHIRPGINFVSLCLKLVPYHRERGKFIKKKKDLEITFFFNIFV